MRSDSPTTNHRSTRQRNALAAGLLVLLTFACYLPVVTAGFVWDDDAYVTNNPGLGSFDGLKRSWFDPRFQVQYYPLVFTTFWLEHKLWGLNPVGFHLVNVAWHACAVVLLWRVLLRLRVPGAWLAAAIFAVHPVMVESVAWVTELKNVLSMSLALAAMLCYFRFAPPDGEVDASRASDTSRTAPDRNRRRLASRGRADRQRGPTTSAAASSKASARQWGYYAAALGLFALALFSKTMVVTLPAVLLVIAWWKRGRIVRDDVVYVLPFFALSIAMGLLTEWVEREHVGAAGTTWAMSPVERVLLAGRVLWFYAGKLVWPYPLIFHYPRWEIDARVWWQYLFPLAALATMAGLWLARHRIGRGPLAAVLIFVGVLTPVLGFFNIYYFQYSFVADHFAYHASVALIALAAAGAVTVVGRWSPGPGAQRTAIVVAAIVLIALGTLTWRQTRVYRDLETMLTLTIEANPAAWNAYVNLANHLATQSRIVEAVEVAQRGVEHAPHRPEVHNCLGGHAFILAAQRRPSAADYDRAIESFREALRLNPDYDEACFNLATTLAHADRHAEAIPYFERAAKLYCVDGQDRDAEVLAAWGNSLLAVGRYEAAEAVYRRALGVDSSYAPARAGLARAAEAIQNRGRE